ncbi:alpha/beta fold hydrolase [Rhodocaloribacter litoris]|uniref:alpha/beta hydrolase n=1 Tax=Rhodocaloribacter litoris TaxID=2558931 RepID=UPI00141EF2B1|nr:alpha/beta fold hydrolase [Rhodocaloribacter litoris]QXD15917.1 alpha/beta fold hydrolase [Rhodocaloribacter litoris]
MRRTIWGLGGLVAVLGLLWMLGPRPAVEEPAGLPVLPGDLDAYLAAAEARFDDLRPGVEKTIVWADPATRSRTPVAVVYLHGFSATREETRPLCDTLAARLGANLFYTRLTGHGRTGEALAAATASDWLHDALEALAVGRRLGERVMLVGTSTGGTLATWLAARYPEALAAVILISPNFGPKDPRTEIFLWPWGDALARAVAGDEHAWEPANEAQARFWTTRYPIEALRPMMAVVAHVNDLDLEAITTPVLVIYSPNDQVVEPAHIEAQYARFGGRKHRIAIERAGGSNHVLAGDILAPEMTLPLADSILAFLGAVP